MKKKRELRSAVVSALELADRPDRAEAAAAILVARENLILSAFEWYDIGGVKQEVELREAVKLLRENMQAYRAAARRSR